MARLKLKLQLYCGDEIAMGPGKADLLEAIAREGSISAAGRALGMSYRRAWLLVDTMNRCFRAAAGRDASGRRQERGRQADAGGRERRWRPTGRYRRKSSGTGGSRHGDRPSISDTRCEGGASAMPTARSRWSWSERG